MWSTIRESVNLVHVKKSKAELEQIARDLRAMAATDSSALSNLSEAYWSLGQKDAALETFAEYLQRTDPYENRAFNDLYLTALRVTTSCPTPIRRRYRLMYLVELLDSTSDVDGLVVECGCYLGLSSYVLCSFLRQRESAFDGNGYHIFDSFEGLSEPTADDDIPDDWNKAEQLRQMTKAGHFAAPLAAVKESLKEFPAITYHPGWIPASFAGLAPSPYRFVHVDVDLYDPTLDTLTYFYPRLSPGGLIVSDDYSWPGARTAINEFCGEHRIALQLTNFGQAIIRKLPA